jgi:hypothetical protein
VPTDWACGCKVMRTHTVADGGEAVVLWCPLDDHRPSFRREREIDGQRWWIAEENGRRILAFECPGGGGIWCFVGPQDEATLLAAAKTYRAKLAAASE